MNHVMLTLPTHTDFLSSPRFDEYKTQYGLVLSTGPELQVQNLRLSLEHIDWLTIIFRLVLTCHDTFKDITAMRGAAALQSKLYEGSPLILVPTLKRPKDLDVIKKQT